MRLGARGFRIYPYNPDCFRWAVRARDTARRIVSDPKWQDRRNLRHAKTWFVGVDALPNDADGTLGGTRLAGPWIQHVPPLPLHRAQLSIVYPGYPGQDPGESDAAHRFRRDAKAAHVDGLLPVGPQKRRFAREFHAYILALPLTEVTTAPTVVWPGSHRIMRAALTEAIGDQPIDQVDLTEAYKAARRTAFERCTPYRMLLQPGQSALLHRFLLHGTDVWEKHVADPAGLGRMIAFFRPDCAGGAREWLTLP